MKKMIFMGVIAGLSAFTPYYWLIVGIIILYSFIVYINNDNVFWLIVLTLFVFGLIRFATLESIKEQTLINTQVVRDITFADDSNSAHYKVGMTETVVSYVFNNKVDYFNNKSTYLQRFSPDRKDTYQENCYVNTYKETFGYIYVLDKPKQILECY